MEIALPAWRETPTKQAILDFVAAVTDASGPHFVPPEARIAVFDNDGTLWCEKPLYVQMDYLLRKLAARAQADHSLRTRQPWKAAFEQDFGWFGEAVTKHYQGDDSDLRIVLGGILALSADQNVEDVEAAAKLFVENERHPTLGLPYRDCVYTPMLELLRYLEAHDFTNYIVSGSGRDFMRGFAHELYGVPRERVLGSSVTYRYVEDEGGGVIMQQAELDVANDGAAKVTEIWSAIGQRPILAAGNSNGDLPMLKFAGGDLPTLRLLVVHDDGEREFEYIAGAEKALQTVQQQGWTSVNIKQTWDKVFANDVRHGSL